VIFQTIGNDKIFQLIKIITLTATHIKAPHIMQTCSKCNVRFICISSALKRARYSLGVSLNSAVKKSRILSISASCLADKRLTSVFARDVSNGSRPYKFSLNLFWHLISFPHVITCPKMRSFRLDLQACVGERFSDNQSTF